MKRILMFGLVLTLFATAASAQRGPGDKARQHRVAEGYNSGELSRHEMRKLHHGKKFYNYEKRKAFRDGRLTYRERRHLAKLKRHDSRQVYRYKHNRQRRHF